MSKLMLGTLSLALLVAASACASEGNAQTSGAAIVRDDAASVTRLLDAVRGSDPLLCELATRDVDMHGSWSRWGPLGGSPIESDSASAAMRAHGVGEWCRQTLGYRLDVEHVVEHEGDDCVAVRDDVRADEGLD